MSDKKKVIELASLKCFAKNGYKKTSINDIAVSAGVAKGLVFYHYKNKKQLFLTIFKDNSEKMAQMLSDDVTAEADFFDRIELIMQKKILFILKNPYAFDFLTKAYYENDISVKNELQKIICKIDKNSKNLYLAKIEKRKFKKGVNMEACVKIVVWVTDGIFKNIPKNKDRLKHKVIELTKYLQMLKKSFYIE